MGAVLNRDLRAAERWQSEGQSQSGAEGDRAQQQERETEAQDSSADLPGGGAQPQETGVRQLLRGGEMGSSIFRGLDPVREA